MIIPCVARDKNTEMAVVAFQAITFLFIMARVFRWLQGNERTPTVLGESQAVSLPVHAHFANWPAWIFTIGLSSFPFFFFLVIGEDSVLGRCIGLLLCGSFPLYNNKESKIYLQGGLVMGRIPCRG